MHRQDNRILQILILICHPLSLSAFCHSLFLLFSSPPLFLLCFAFLPPVTLFHFSLCLPVRLIPVNLPIYLPPLLTSLPYFPSSLPSSFPYFPSSLPCWFPLSFISTTSISSSYHTFLSSCLPSSHPRYDQNQQYVQKVPQICQQIVV